MYFENHLNLDGRLTEKPELKTTKNGKNYCQFSICHNEYRKLSAPNSEGKNYDSIAHFFRVTVWNKEAVNVSNMNKGDAISIIGKLNYSEWTDENNAKKSLVSIVAFHIRKLETITKSEVEETDEIEETEILDIPAFEEIPAQKGLF